MRRRYSIALRLAQKLAAPFALAAVVLSGCGGGGGDPGTELELFQASRDFYIAFLEGDADSAYEHYGGRCRDEVSQQEFRDFLAVFSSLLELVAGDSEYFLQDIHLRNVDGSRGETQPVVVTDLNDDVPPDTLGWQIWSFIDGRWLLADCESPFD